MALEPSVGAAGWAPTVGEGVATVEEDGDGAGVADTAGLGDPDGAALAEGAGLGAAVAAAAGGGVAAASVEEAEAAGLLDGPGPAVGSGLAEASPSGASAQTAAMAARPRRHPAPDVRRARHVDVAIAPGPRVHLADLSSSA